CAFSRKNNEDDFSSTSWADFFAAWQRSAICFNSLIDGFDAAERTFRPISVSAMATVDVTRKLENLISCLQLILQIPVKGKNEPHDEERVPYFYREFIDHTTQ